MGPWAPGLMGPWAPRPHPRPGPGSNGPWAETGPGPKWALGPMDHGPRAHLDPNGPNGSYSYIDIMVLARLVGSPRWLEGHFSWYLRGLLHVTLSKLQRGAGDCHFH